jgi:hypothetical protein
LKIEKNSIMERFKENGIRSTLTKKIILKNFFFNSLLCKEIDGRTGFSFSRVCLKTIKSIGVIKKNFIVHHY